MRWIPLILGLSYFLSELALNLTRRAPKSDNVRQVDRSSLRALWVVIMLAIFFAVEIATRNRSAGIHPRDLALVAGVIVFLIGLAFRWWAIIVLGRFFTVNVAIARDHQLVETGPYRLVRHPSYTGSLIAFVGFGLSLANWLALVVLLVPIFAVMAHRMNVEEEALQDGLGATYAAYMQRTKRLLPFVY